ncbi:hypothetical protein ACFX13_016476 [Malus domestica]
MKERMLKVALRPQVGQAYLKKVTEFVMTESKNREAEVVLEGLLDAMDWYSDNQQETARSALHVVMQNLMLHKKLEKWGELEDFESL